MADAATGNFDPTDANRDDVIGVLAQAIRDVKQRIDEFEVTEPEDEQMLNRWYRTLATLAGQYRMLKKDTDIDEMADRLDILEAAREEGHR